MSAERRSFTAEIHEGRGGGAFVEVPFSVKDVYGTGAQVRVQATFDGYEYRGSVAPMGGGAHALGVTKAIREALGKGVGDSVFVTVEQDLAPRTADVPTELSVALDASAQARSVFEGLSYTHQKEYARWVAEAKKQETRDRRAGRAVEMLLGGAKAP